MIVNRMLAVASLCAAGLLVSCAANPPADRPTAPASAATQPAAGKPDDVICRSEVPSGSHRPVRNCRTREAWEAARRASAGALDDLQRRSPVLPKGN